MKRKLAQKHRPWWDHAGLFDDRAEYAAAAQQSPDTRHEAHTEKVTKANSYLIRSRIRLIESAKRMQVDDEQH